MNSKIVSCFLLCLFISLIFSVILPYPNFNNTILLPSQEKIVNDSHEYELKEQKINVNKKTIFLYDWFDIVDNLFKKFKTVKVFDVKTGKSFYIQRVGGINHAEVETTSIKETDALKKILKHGWSWDRRPVVVCINGLYIAASISVMPHGYNILDNGLSGHFCMHFLNSKTHGTNRVDRLHQKNVLYAKKRGLKVLF